MYDICFSKCRRISRWFETTYIMEIGPDKVHLTSLKEIGCSMAPPKEENKAQEIKV